MSSKRAAHRMIFGKSASVNKNDESGRLSARRRIGSLQKDTLLFLLKGASFALSAASRKSPRVPRILGDTWKKIDRKVLNQSIAKLYESQLVDMRKESDGTITLVLTKEGRRIALSYDIDNIKIPVPAHWDGKWRIVLFDVPTEKNRLRDSLRGHLKAMGFYEFQHSVFVHPHPCAVEIDYVIEFYDARRYLRFITATEIDNALQLQKHFGIVG